MSRIRARLRRLPEKSRNPPIRARHPKGATTMKFILMMNAPRGDGDWNVAKWPLEDQKAMIGFMKRFGVQLAEEGALVAAEGLAPPGQARIVRGGKTGAPEVTD